jgi:hypothetical protein
MKRRDFLKLSAAGVATLIMDPHIPGVGEAEAAAATHSLNITITDCLKEMATYNAVNTGATCYFWIYKMTADGVDVTAECPGPTMVMVKGESVSITITNALDEPHSFFVPGMFDSGPIAPGATYNGTFTATVSGAHLYYDNLNDPVNRVMGLHGALIVRPAAAAAGHKLTPYDNPTANVQSLYDAFGSTDYFPGLAWDQGDAATNVPPYRAYCWLLHQASPILFAEVGNYPAGLDYPAQQFVDLFLNDPFVPNGNNRVPDYFTINGQSGFFSHFSPEVTMMGRVGEPCVVHILNAGLWLHSCHIHANHIYVTSVNGQVSPNPIWVDVYTVKPMDRVDYTVPYMRPPDNANLRGIGRPDAPLTSLSGTPVWPPVEELNVFMPGPGESMAQDINGNTIDLKQRMSPLCYPMHDHSEPSQTAQGGNYNMGLISGIYFIGDRNTPGYMDFPMDSDFAMMFRNTRGCSDGDFADEAAGPPPG